MGIDMKGLFLQVDRYRNVDQETGAVSFRVAIAIACGINSYRVFMVDDFDDSALDGIKVGTPIKVTCRPYVGKNGRLNWSDGDNLKIGEIA